MLVFITSLRHPHNCHSYQRVGRLLEHSLRSVCNQTNSNFHVIVVCNQQPEITPDERVSFVQVGFPAPSPKNQPNTGMRAIRLDRGSKYLVGFNVARKYNPSHVMFFDADDLISNRICETVCGQPGDTAWVFEQGFQLRAGSDRCTLKSEFYKLCGTSFIHPISSLVGSPSVDHETSLDEIIKVTGHYTLNSVFGAHRNVVNHYHRVLHREVTPMPYPGAMWVLNTGENHSGRGAMVGDVLLTQRMRKEFLIPDVW